LVDVQYAFNTGLRTKACKPAGVKKLKSTSNVWLVVYEKREASRHHLAFHRQTPAKPNRQRYIWALINDVRQASINILRLQPPHILHNLEAVMSALSIPSQDVEDDARFFSTVARFCCCGLVASLCLIALGMDLAAGWL
jgi:hypothetical protein